MPENGEESTRDISAESAESVLRMNWFYSFFCWCSGARMYVLKQCPTDYNTFFGIGIVIFLTGIMASLSGSYAFYTVFNNSSYAIVFGMFWGILIFFLDWYLVSSLKKQSNMKKELVLSIPRFIFAFFLAVVISKPVEMKLFESEINAEIADYQLKRSKRQQTTVSESFREIEKLEDDNENMALQIKIKETQRNELFSLVIAEAEGRSATGQSGRGPVFREKKQALQMAEDELSGLNETLLPLIKANSERIIKLREQKDQQFEMTVKAGEQATGFLARIEAMNRLSKKSAQTSAVSIFITLLFLCIESAPIFVKLISSRGVYDLLLEVLATEHSIRIEELAYKNAMAHDVGTRSMRQRVQKEMQLSEKQHDAFLDELSVAKSECDQKVVKEWKRQELERIDKNFVQYLPKIQAIFNTK